MLVVELKNEAGQTQVQFDILPSAGLPEPVVIAQVELARQLASSLGTAYYFLVTTDWVRGWDMTDGRQRFKQPTADLFRQYAGGDTSKIEAAGEYYLAALTQAWVADLTSHWRTSNAPGEDSLQASGVLSHVRSAATAHTGSL